jgi:hypothetical protein
VEKTPMIEKNQQVEPPLAQAVPPRAGPSRNAPQTPKTGKTAAVDPATLDLDTLTELVHQGRRDLIPLLRERLRAKPEVWKLYGDLGKQAGRLWMKAIAGQDEVVMQSLAMCIDLMERELTGANASALERLLVSNLATSWLRLGYLDRREALRIGTDPAAVDELLIKRQGAAHVQFTRAVLTLATVRKLEAQTAASPRAQDSRPDASEAAEKHEAAAAKSNGRRKAKRAPKRVNGNGHPAANGQKLPAHRFSHLLEPVAAGTDE